MSERIGLWREQQGAVSLYLIMILVPVFLLCGLLIDVVRWETAAKETETAVKAGVRSALSAYSPALHAYGLFALGNERAEAIAAFTRTVRGNVSGQQAGRFELIDNEFEADQARLTPMYPLSNHEVFKRQILEEMKYRAPLTYSLEIADKFKKNGLAQQLGQASKFTEEAAKLEKPLAERDDRLDEAWAAFLDIRQKVLDIHPFYQAQLRDLNVLSDRIGIHTVEEVSGSLRSAQAQIQSLSNQIRGIDGSIIALAQAGGAAVDAIRQLNDQRQRLQTQFNEASVKVTQFEQLLADLTRYAELLGTMKLKSASDEEDLTGKLETFRTAMKAAMEANDELNAEVRQALSSVSADQAMAAEQSFGSIRIIARDELERFVSDTAGAVALFSGVTAQIGDGLLFTGQKYTSTTQSLDAMLQSTQKAYESQQAAQSDRMQQNSGIKASQREERNKAQPVLDQIKRGLGACSLITDVDPYQRNYLQLQGDASQAGSTGFYQAYMEQNQEGNAVQPVPDVQLQDADHAGASAMKLLTSITEFVEDVRDEFYVNEYALNKFNYRTYGMETDPSGAVKPASTLSKPESHSLANQEVEYLLYGSSTCAGNLSLAYAEMFAIRLAVGMTEALTEPKNSTLAAGSPLLVVLAAVAEGAVNAQKDMAKLIQGESVPLSGKLGSLITLSYKDYLRLFLLMHSRDAVLLSRMQALLQLNTGMDLSQTATYVSGSAATSFRLWFMPGAARSIGRGSSFAGCVMTGSRCMLTRTADFTY